MSRATKVNIETTPGAAATVAATFTGDSSLAYGPLEVRHTPMVLPTPVTLDTPGCDAAP